MSTLFRPSKEKCACGNAKSQVAQCCWECRKRPETGICAVCERIFTFKASSRKKTCSRQCGYQLRGTNSGNTQSKRIPLQCKYCGKIRLVPPSKATRAFCSPKCHYAANSGENNPGWKGGITAAHQAFFGSPEWKKVCARIW